MAVDRVAAAQERLESVKSLAMVAREAGPPCSDCRYHRLLGYCGNPAYAETVFKPELGDYSQRFETSIATARADHGLCGPEALLFEYRSPVMVAIGAFGLGLRKAWLGFAVALFAITIFSALSGYRFW